MNPFYFIGRDSRWRYFFEIWKIISVNKIKLHLFLIHFKETDLISVISSCPSLSGIKDRGIIKQKYSSVLGSFEQH